MTTAILATVAASVVQFLIGFIWHGPLFGKLWGTMHGFDELPKATQEKMMKQMGPFYGLQLFVTVVSSAVLTFLIMQLSGTISYLSLAFFCWLGFIVPAQVSDVIFGGTEPQWIGKKIAILASGALICTLAGAFVIQLII